MKHKKLTEYEHVGCDGPGCGDCALKDDNRLLCSLPCPQDNIIHLIPAADAERYDSENAAKDAVVEAAGEPVKRLIKLGGCTGEICNECIDGCQHYPYCLALAALKQVRDE